MSGQLVGEVIAASDTLRARGLSERGFHALVAIAEKASVSDRTASVRWDHVCAGLYGASHRTARRAVDDLLECKVIRIVKVGFKNEHAARAPVYEILPLADHDTQVSLSTESDRDTYLSSSAQRDDDTQVSSSAEADRANSHVDSDKPGSGSCHSGVLLDGSFDGSSDGGRPTYSPRCARHIHDEHPPACGGCGRAREAAKAAAAVAEQRDAALRARTRAAIDGCRDCDQYGRLDDLSDCPRHPSFRVHRESA